MATFETTEVDAGARLDQFLAHRIPETSRAKIQRWIEAGGVRVNGEVAKAAMKLRGGEHVSVESVPAEASAHAFAEEIPLDVLYEDDDLIAINKPAGMTVHIGAGVTRGTLVNALLHHFRSLSGVGGELRPGIVHRLDRLTSGVLLVAKTDAAHLNLARQFASRQVRKTYWALVHGHPPAGSAASSRLPARATGKRVIVDGTEWRRLEMPITRDRRQRVRMTARSLAGRAALTDFRVLEKWPRFALLEVRIGTGRTHQIRVHLSTIGHPVVGDALYGAPRQPALPRFFLHAREIAFAHPSGGRQVKLQASLPAELEAELAALRQGISQLVLL